MIHLNLQSYLYCIHSTNFNLELRCTLTEHMLQHQVAMISSQNLICSFFTIPYQLNELNACWFCCHGLHPWRIKWQMTQHFYCLHLYTSGIWSFQLTYLMKSILWCQWNDHSTFVYNGNPFLNYVQYEIDVRPVNMWHWAISCHVVPLKVNLQMANFVEDSNLYTLVIWSWQSIDNIVLIW